METLSGARPRDGVVIKVGTRYGDLSRLGGVGAGGRGGIGR